MFTIQVILLQDGHGGLVSVSEVQVGSFSPSGWEDGVGWGVRRVRGAGPAIRARLLVAMSCRTQIPEGVAWKNAGLGCPVVGPSRNWAH